MLGSEKEANGREEKTDLLVEKERARREKAPDKKREREEKRPDRQLGSSLTHSLGRLPEKSPNPRLEAVLVKQDSYVSVNFPCLLPEPLC